MTRLNSLSPAGLCARRIFELVWLLTATVATFATPAFGGGGWDKIDPADLAATESKSNPGADAEFLFYRSDVREDKVNIAFVGDLASTVNETYARAKIYTAKGVEDQGRFSIYHDDEHNIENIVARVVKRDGTSIDLKKSDIFDKTILNARGRRIDETTFAFPNLEPGDIIEYRWRTWQRESDWARWSYAQQTVPVREFRMRLANSEQTRVNFRNCPGMKATQDSGIVLTMHNVPAFEEEPFMPAERDFRGWIYSVRTFDEPNDEKMWKEISGIWGEEFKLKTVPSDEMKNKAKELTAGVADDEEKLHRLYDFCQSDITNFTYFNTAALQKEREKTKDGDRAQTARETFDRKYGWSIEVNRLFAGLARALGFESRTVRSTGRDSLGDVKSGRGWAFMERDMVGVNVGGQWKMFNPGDYLCPFGTLAWWDQGVTGLLCDESRSQATFVDVPLHPASESKVQRTASFNLTDDGTIEGDVSLSWTGSLARARKWDALGEADDVVDKAFREEMQKQLPEADITGLKWENLRTREIPVVASFHVRVPGLFERAGSRIVIRPGFFEMGKEPVFTAATRKYPIAFLFARQEFDQVEITLPDGFELDHPSAPKSVGNVATDIGASYKIGYIPKRRVLRYNREFSLGGTGNATMFRAESYPLLKARFEALRESDSHAIVIKPVAPAAAETPSAPDAAPAGAQQASPPRNP